MNRNVCNQFCNGPKNDKSGINCAMGSYDKHGNMVKPNPLKLNPKTKEAAQNVISNGGRWQICLKNQWRYLGL